MERVVNLIDLCLDVIVLLLLKVLIGANISKLDVVFINKHSTLFLLSICLADRNTALLWLRI